ncbi:MAG TPA: pyrroline-5-carboxylate reductase [SAR202 cluster bacterium]|jgi:pyrroline-5-carboxylate reductase|nr:pyrroline-5-carboxylate reductase [SAR202 cluster bacterium]MDP7413352.1 pyrroline-5-carboxylate reductase [SAR202 cluster bacterium]MDP7533226.1 pyrroline-5-carboxylate reductase [SAR202 cluster bacterium]HJO82486.1 pyrroline-5-carboxylate reductase [SAR202 cluster bacterium]|tara:strand:- start:158 stop:958 length:801 start_codon:yes stop_codon:yes gene_type:complete
MRIAFIGGGIMAEAIIGGIIESKIAPASDVHVGEPVPARRQHLEQMYGLTTHAVNLEALDGAVLSVLAVKPQTLPYVLPELRGKIATDNTVLSIVAGATMKTLVDGLGHEAVIRVMPNTPAQIGAGMTVWTAAAAVPAEATETTKRILGTLGEEHYADEEKLIDMATALSASGPAYAFMFVEALIDAGVYLGMARDVARKLALQTVLGSTQLVKETGKHPAELKDMVTSPGGTTIEAVRALEDGGFRAAIISAVNAAFEKSKALGS